MNAKSSSSGTGSPDEKLVEACRHGGPEAFALLVGRYRRELHYFLMRFVNDAAAADDLFQETFLQVHLSLDTFDTQRNFRPWLFTIAANKARDYLRKRKQAKNTPLTTVTDSEGQQQRSLVEMLEDGAPWPVEAAQDKETQHAVREVVESMPDHLREVLLLSYFHHFAYKEIAQMLGIPLGTVKSRLHAAVGTFVDLWKRRYGSTSEENPGRQSKG